MPDTSEVAQSPAHIFGELKDDPIWVASDASKTPYNREGEPFNSWSDPDTKLGTLAEAQATADKFNLPNVGIIFPAAGIVRNGYRLLVIDADEVKGYRKYRKGKPGKPGCSAIAFDPVADADKVLARVPLVAQLPATVWEASVSCTSLHGFLWVPEDQTAAYWGRNGAKLAGCDHVDTFLAGRKARHLIVTGKLLTGCTTIARLDSIEPLEAILQRAGAQRDLPELLIPDEGTPSDLAALPWLNDDQRTLVTVVGKTPGGIDRSSVMHGFLIALIDRYMPFANILASLCNSPATVDYLLYHRNQDPVAALEFARYEIRQAYAESTLYMQHRIKQYFPAWADGELLVDPDAGAPEAPLCESLSSFMADRKRQEVLIEGILYKGDHNAGLGHPNAGKTTGTLELTMHLGFGIDLGKRKVVRSRVLYLAGEDPNGIRRRIELWCQAHHKETKDLDGWLFIVRRPVLDDKEQVEKLLMELEAVKPELIVVDTFSANYGGESEDKATEVKKWMKMVREDFVGRFNCCVVTLHHPPKGSDDIYNWRGSGAAPGDLDNVFGFSKLGDKIRMDQGDGRAKHRTAEFDPIIWLIETAPIKGWLNNLGKQETSVKATLADDLKMDIPAAKLCLAIKVLGERGADFSHAEVAKLAGIPPGSMAYQLGKLKSKGGVRDHPLAVMVTERKDGRLGLTKAGKELAVWALVDKEMGERIRALQPVTEGEDDDAAE